MKHTMFTALGTLCVALLLVGCGKKNDDPKAEPAPASGNQVSAANATSAAKTASDTAPDSTNDGDSKAAPDPASEAPMEKSGVPECDDYVAKVLACVARDRFPAKQRKAVRASLDKMVVNWQRPGNQRTASLGCKAALETAKQQYASVGCEF